MSMAESRPPCNAPRYSVVMGVAGSGKSTVGQAFAATIGGLYLEADDFHSPGNLAKMSNGIPLTDEDRWPWLDRFSGEMAKLDPPVVGGCSALRRVYRDRIREAIGETVLFIHLTGSRELIASRMAHRTGHYMPLSLLDSQFATLEPLEPDEYAVAVDIAPSTDEIVAAICVAIDRLRT